MTRWLLPGVGGAALLASLLLAPAAALAGWRAVFVGLGAVPIGAVMLLLVARSTGADWDAALLPFAMRAWLLVPAFLPVVVEQAVVAAVPAHLAAWLDWPWFLVRGLIATGFWWWLSRRLATGRVSPLGAGLALVAHGILLTIVGTEWLLGTSPGQPNSAVAMLLTTLGVAAATGAACLAAAGPERARRDLSFLLIAGALGSAYLVFMDFLIVWFGNLPTRVGWYVERITVPWGLLPPLALLVGLLVPIAGIALVRTEGARRIAGAGTLAGVLLVAAWFVTAPRLLGLLALAGGAALVAGTAKRPA